MLTINLHVLITEFKIILIEEVKTERKAFFGKI